MTLQLIAQTPILVLLGAGITVMFCGTVAMWAWRKPEINTGALFFAGSYAAAHPELYIRPDRVAIVRVLNLTGVGLFLFGVVLLVIDAVWRVM